MRVYRLEDNDGYGVYALDEDNRIVDFQTARAIELLNGLKPSNYSEEQLDDIRQISYNTHKPIYEDGILIRKIKEREGKSNVFAMMRKYMCGFASKEQMLRWFPLEGLMALSDIPNLALSVYEADDEKTIVSPIQCLLPMKLKTVSRIGILEFIQNELNIH